MPSVLTDCTPTERRFHQAQNYKHAAPLEQSRWAEYLLPKFGQP